MSNLPIGVSHHFETDRAKGSVALKDLGQCDARGALTTTSLLCQCVQQ